MQDDASSAAAVDGPASGDDDDDANNGDADKVTHQGDVAARAAGTADDGHQSPAPVAEDAGVPPNAADTEARAAADADANAFPDIDVQPAVLAGLASTAPPAPEPTAAESPVRAPTRERGSQGASRGGAAGPSAKAGGGTKKAPPADARASGTTQVPRGQRSKQRKIKEKYGDQDDEDRELMMKIIAVRRGRRECRTALAAVHY